MDKLGKEDGSVACILSEVKRLRKALEFYGNITNHMIDDHYRILTPVERDYGQIARKALGKEKEYK